MTEQTLKPKVAVTGAGGMVGSHICQFLASEGLDVVAVIRSMPEHLRSYAESYSGNGSITLIKADVGEVATIEKTFAGCDAVVHAAGSVDPFGSRESIFATNCGGTQNALQAAKSAGIKQFIFISSLSVITGQGDQFNVDESAPLRPCGESYADSKIEAEKSVMAQSGQSAMKVTVLRPGFIYGPRERSWMPRLITSITSGKAMLIDGGTKQTNVIYVGNLCRAVILALLNETAYGQVYNLTDGEVVSKKELFDAIADGLSLPRVTKKVPGSVAKFACELISALAPSLPLETQKKLARFSRAAFRLAGVNQGFSIAKAESELGYTDRISFQEGMSRTLVSFRMNQINEPIQREKRTAAR